MNEPMVIDTTKVFFHREQYKLLLKMFPDMVFPPSATHAEMMFHNGQRSVLEYIKCRVK